METVKKELELENLCCANCAAKIEEQVSKLPYVAASHLNFTTKTLTIEAQDWSQVEEIMKKTEAIVKKFDPHVVLREKRQGKTSRNQMVLVLEGLDCANCAQKIERDVQKIPGVNHANLDFFSNKLTIQAEQLSLFPKILEEAKQIIKRHEPHVNVVEEQEKENVFPEEINNKRRLIRLLWGALLFGLAFLPQLPFPAKFLFYLVSYLLVGYEVIAKALRNIFSGQIFDENFLMTLATVGAFLIHEYPEGVAVMLFYQIGEYFQDLAVNRSRRSIKALLDIKPDYANLQVNGQIIKVDPQEVKVGDLILVKPGERVPLDGIIRAGESLVDTSALTGEAIPRPVTVGDEILSGFINQNGLLTVEVTKTFTQSTVAKILELVQNASNRKAPTEKFITKFARYYTPVVVLAALAIAFIPPLLLGGEFSTWLYRALVFLVISCPCALVISIPLGFFGGIGGASKKGILIKGGNFLEALNQVDTVVFDKTGTLTKGTFTVSEIRPQVGFTPEEVLEYAALAESYSNHPIALSILRAYGKEVPKEIIESYEQIPGQGVRIQVSGREILVGNRRLLNSRQISYPQKETVGTTVYVAVDGVFAGSIVITDQLKEDAKETIRELRKLSLKKLIMLTGDNPTAGKKIAQELGLDEVYCELLPEQKVETLEKLYQAKSSKGKILYMGDGINDAPVLARADIGVAMGAMGSDAAIEAADVVLMTDEPSKLVTALKIARKTRRIVTENIVFALGVKLLVMALGAFGLASLWEAVFADVGVALIAVFNAMRVMNVKNI